MSRMLAFTTIAFAAGIASAMLFNSSTQAYAASNIAILELDNSGDVHRVASTCDFSKSIAVVGMGPFLVICQEK